MALFLLAIGVIGLIVNKVRSGIHETRKDAFDDIARQHLNAYLFAAIESDPHVQMDVYREELMPHLYQLQQNLKIGNSSISNPRRRSLKRVALTVTTEMIGETRTRLGVLFEYFGFVEEAIRALSDSSWWVRAKGCLNAGLMRSELSLPYLEQRLDDDNDDVRIEAAQAMIDIAGVESLAPILMRLKELSLWMQVRLSKSILAFRGDAVPQLEIGIRSEYPAVQGFCIDLLGMIGDVSAVPTILEYIDHEDPVVQQKSLIAFGKIGDTRAIPIIHHYLQSENRELRYAATKAAINLASPDIALHLHNHLLNEDIEIKLAAAEALSRSGETGVKSLLYASRFDDERVQLIAHQFLHDLGVTASDNGGEIL